MKRKVIALLMAGMMVQSAGYAGTTVYADTGKDKVSKTESVYVTAKANGSVKKIKVKETLKNPGGNADIEDYSKLTNIRNTDGEETYTEKGDGNLVWQNKGEDISYEGESSEKLPVSVKVRYFLNGKELKAKDMAGVSGKVKIRFEYKNQTKENVETDGTEEAVTVPFTALSALMLPTDHFSNVEVSNGKVMDQDGQSIVLGLAFPGLADSLGLKDYELVEDIELPDYIEVTADVKDFSLDFTATILSSGLFSEMDTEDLKDAEDLTDSMGKLTDASSKLVDGTDELANGLSQMQSYMGEYTSGEEKLNSGAKALSTALGTLDSNGSRLKEGAAQIKNGLGTLSGVLGKVEIPEGTAQVSEAAGNIGQSADDTLKKLTTLRNSVQSAKESVEAINIISVNEQIRKDAAALAKSQLEITLNDLTAAGKITEDQKQLTDIQGVLTATDAEGFMTSLDQLNTEVMALKEYTRQLSSLSGNVAYLKGTLAQLNTAAAKLSAGSESLAAGMDAYTSGVSQIYAGANVLTSGTEKLSAAGRLLNTGMTALASGSNTLAEEMKKFDKEGIQKLGDLAGDDLENVLHNVKAVKKADEAYQSFGGIKDGQKGEVKFIIETKEIK